MVLGKAVGKANYFLSPDENPGNKPKVLHVLRLNRSPQRAAVFGPCKHILVFITSLWIVWV